MVKNPRNTINYVETFPHSSEFYDCAVFRLAHFRTLIGNTDKPHRLAFFGLILVEQGEVTTQVDFADMPMPADTLLVFQANQIHRFMLNAGVDGWAVLFQPELLPTTHGTALLERLQNLPQINRLDSEQAAWCKGLIGLLHQAQQHNRPTPIADSINSQLICALIAQLSLFAQATDNTPHSAQNRLYQAFKGQLEIHFCEQHRVRFYTEQLACTEKTLTASCQQMGGNTPKQLIAQRLILEAKRLLIHSKQSINQIAFELGFDETTNFIKFFKKQMGITPRQFRLGQG